jgi:hypothetical protein
MLAGTMSLPATVRVKLSSEAAGAISITPVVVRDMPSRELIENMLGLTGKDVDRVRELLLRGALVNGASRFRWQGWEADPGGIRQILDTFPDPNPSRPFQANECTRALLRGPHAQIEIPREAAAKKRFLRRTSYWDVLLNVVGAADPAYQDYSYRDRADTYRIALTAESAATLRTETAKLTYSTLAQQIRFAQFDTIDLFLPR